MANTQLLEPEDNLEAQFSAAPKNQRGFRWLPAGPWCIEGKLDPNFRDWLANDWMKQYGGTIHQKRADVLSHFKKDPDNLSIRWEQYQSEISHRVANTQTLLDHGVTVKPETQKLLIENHRALTAELPEDLNPIATVESPALSPATPEIEPEETDQETLTPSNNCVTTEDGRRLEVFQREEVKPASPEQAKEMREMVQGFLAGFCGGTDESEETTLEEIQEGNLAELNCWISDPVLRSEAMQRVMASDCYECLFDDDGNPYEVVYRGENAT